MKLEIDKETADRITVLNLKDYAQYLKKELSDYEKGEWLHPSDVIGNKKFIEAIEFILRDYFDVET